MKKLEPLCIETKQYHSTVLFSGFKQNGHTAWFDPQMKKLEPHGIAKQIVLPYSTVLFSSFTKNGHTV